MVTRTLTLALLTLTLTLTLAGCKPPALPIGIPPWPGLVGCPSADCP